MSDIVQIFGRFQILFQNTAQALYNTPHYNTDLNNNTVILWLPKCIAMELFCHGILQRNYRKMTILWSFSYNSFVKLSPL